MSQRKIIAVTGAASGIGLAVVQRLHADGHLVISLDLPSKTEVQALAQLGVESLALDVTDEASVARAHAQIIAKHGAVDGLVNSAGVIQKRQSPDQLSMQDWDRVVNTNMRGTYVCCAIFGAHMVKQGRGAIVNIASITSYAAVPLHAYAPSKAGVLSITQCLAAEWGHAGIRVTR